ncbi:hypothetical protein [uncultured Hymenobacter sp.]
MRALRGLLTLHGHLLAPEETFYLLHLLGQPVGVGFTPGTPVEATTAGVL